MVSLDGVLIGLIVFPFFLSIAQIWGFPGGLFNQGQETLLTVCHESIELVGAQKLRVYQV